jgi:hypothetical protein
VRGVRFNLVYGGSADVADFENVAKRVWARRPFLPSDTDLLRDNIGAANVRKVFFDNAVKFSRPYQMPVYNG